jgi:fructose/tagatose bisphosphate aldolase
LSHSYNVTVEGESGVLAGVEDANSSQQSHYTKPEEVEDFVRRTGFDSLAISIGTSQAHTNSGSIGMELLGEGTELSESRLL